MGKPKVVCVISARNEENFISDTIDSLISQSIPPKLIVIVDDGSVDKTTNVISKYKKKGVELIVRKDRIGGPSMLGTPMMALPFNIAFKFIEDSKIDFDYIMISGADCIFQEDYIKIITERLSNDNKLVIASGFQFGESINRDHARGAGRIIKEKFWKMYGAKYPYPSYLWESGIIFYAQMHGLKVRGYTDVYYNSQRTSGSNINMIRYGRMLRAIGYPVLIVIGRALRIIQRTGIKSAIKLLAGYFLKPIQTFEADDEIRKYISKNYLAQKIRYFLFSIF
jgi:glycosyltransferase involved in cell wall biosynthesis